MADGSLDDTLRIRYTCYGKLRKQTNCTGQTGYTVHILDEIIDKAVRQIFSKMRGIPKEQIVTKRYEKETTERKKPSARPANAARQGRERPAFSESRNFSLHQRRKCVAERNPCRNDYRARRETQGTGRPL